MNLSNVIFMNTVLALPPQYQLATLLPFTLPSSEEIVIQNDTHSFSRDSTAYYLNEESHLHGNDLFFDCRYLSYIKPYF